MAGFDMRVAIDSGPLDSGHKVRGVGFYTKSLIDAVDQLSKETKGLRIEAFNFEKDAMRMKTGFYDVIHFPYFNPFINTLPKEKQGKIIITIHDLIPLLYPDKYVPGLRGSLRFRVHKNQIQRMVDAIITDTETSKKDIVRLLGVPEKIVYPIHLAAGTIFKQIKDRKELTVTQKKYNLPNKFVLYLGDVNYNKNIPTLIKACEIIDTTLVIVGKQAQEIANGKWEKVNSGIRDRVRTLQGKPHPEEEHWVELQELFAKNKKIYCLGFVPDEDLVHIFNLATVYCQPSYYEGFGLGSLQAMASGTAVVNARTQALVEVAEDAALFADPNSPQQMAKQIDRVIRDSYLRVDLIRAGEKRLTQFSWEKTAKETVGIYQKVFQDERRMVRKEKADMK